MSRATGTTGTWPPPPDRPASGGPRSFLREATLSRPPRGRGYRRPHPSRSDTETPSLGNCRGFEYRFSDRSPRGNASLGDEILPEASTLPYSRDH